MDDGLVKIVVPAGGSAMGTRVYAAGEVEIKGVTSINVDMRPHAPVVATIGMNLKSRLEFEAHPLLTEGTLRASAAVLGYDLVKRKDSAVGAAPKGIAGYFDIDDAGMAWIGTADMAKSRIHWVGPYLRSEDFDVEVIMSAAEQDRSEA